MTDQTSVTSQQSERVECPAAKDPSVRLFIVAAMCLGFGLYCAYEVFISRKYAPEDGANYWFNLIAGFVLMPLSLIPLYLGIVRLRQTLVADADGMGYHDDDKVRWDQITRLVYRGKGLFDVHYSVDGEEDLFKLDSWRIRNFDALVRFIEARLPNVKVEKAK